MKRIAFAVALGLAACSPQAQERAAAASPAPAQAASVHPVSGLQVIPLTISQNGNVHHFRVEVASTEPEQERGLMFREQMGPDEGMIFPHDPPRFLASAGFSICSQTATLKPARISLAI